MSSGFPREVSHLSTPWVSGSDNCVHNKAFGDATSGSYYPALYTRTRPVMARRHVGHRLPVQLDECSHRRSVAIPGSIHQTRPARLTRVSPSSFSPRPSSFPTALPLAPTRRGLRDARIAHARRQTTSQSPRDRRCPGVRSPCDGRRRRRHQPASASKIAPARSTDAHEPVGAAAVDARPSLPCAPSWTRETSRV